MAGETVTRLRGTVDEDRYSNAVVDWTSPDELAIEGAAIAPTASTEDNNGRTAVVSDLTVYLPAGSDVIAGDRMLVRGETFKVDGDPFDWRHPTVANAPEGLEVHLRRAAG